MKKKTGIILSISALAVISAGYVINQGTAINADIAEPDLFLIVFSRKDVGIIADGAFSDIGVEVREW